MDKLTMAHDWYMKHGRETYNLDSDVSNAWQYADAMQAEADERRKKHYDFIPAIMEGIGNAELEEWQPDWSQAPDDAFAWEMVTPEFARWNCEIMGGIDFEEAPIFGYQGNWWDSLRKRP